MAADHVAPMAKAHVVGQSWQRSDGGTWQVLSAGPQSATMPASEAEDGYRAKHESTVQIQDLTDITAEQEQGMDGTRLDALEHAQGVSLAAAATGVGPLFSSPVDW